MKEQEWTNPLQIVGGAIAVLSFVPLMFEIAFGWILTVLLGVAGLAVMTYGYVVAFRFDPNAGDPEPRKALGKKHAVWGDQLTELLATSPNAEQRAPADRPREEGPSSSNVKPA